MFVIGQHYKCSDDGDDDDTNNVSKKPDWEIWW